MTLAQFQRNLRRFIPKSRIRQGGYMDVVGVFNASDYLLRLNKGELQLYNWRERLIPTEEDKYFAAKGRALPQGAKHRGRMQALQILVTMRLITARQAQRIMWGL